MQGTFLSIYVAPPKIYVAPPKIKPKISKGETYVQKAAVWDLTQQLALGLYACRHSMSHHCLSRDQRARETQSC